MKLDPHELLAHCPIYVDPFDTGWIAVIVGDLPFGSI